MCKVAISTLVLLRGVQSCNIYSLTTERCAKLQYLLLLFVGDFSIYLVALLNANTNADC